MLDGTRRSSGCLLSLPLLPRLLSGPGTGPPGVGEAPMAVFWVLRVPRSVQRRRPRIAAGSVLVVAGAVARLRATSAEPRR
jgi:hypothetical protein